ncbi:MAG TPA: hybrid sensor histidine kinase/response regulator [Longimicrobiales bacterium]|nr:hybrid sensor histidine kinase/response regulator [Longimicrobiales bacterium]
MSAVLIVDDSPTQLEALRSVLVDAGLEVLTAGSGEEAFDIACGDRPEIVLSDVVMPGMSGFDLCRAIKQRLGEAAPAVVLLTSLADPRDIVRGLEAGADNYITKPYSPEHLIQRVRWVLENRALRREGQRSEGLRIRFMNEEFVLRAAPEQMLEMLLGSFEDLSHTNRALRASQEALSAASARELEREQRAREEAERTAETMERLAREAEAATRARDDLLATVSHDLRNPIGTIYTSAALLLDLPLDDTQRQRQVQIIKRTAERMNRLIQDLLDASRIEAGHFTVEPHPVTVRSLVDDAHEMLAPIADADGISLSEDVDDPDARVMADAERVQRVLSNLVGNAVKFTPRGGSIHLRVDRDGDMCRFSVHDQGPGIPPENLDRVFDRYWQGNSGAGGGAGLGLAIARGIVAAHGGRIWAESEPGQGATFRFTLPLVHDQAPDAAGS